MSLFETFCIVTQQETLHVHVTRAVKSSLSDLGRKIFTLLLHLYMYYELSLYSF